MSEEGNTFKGEFIGATRMQIEHIKDQLRDLRTELKAIAATLQELRDWRVKVMAYAGLAAGAATLGIQLLMNRLGA